MKRLILILILTFSFQSWTKADDIRDFQIEGMSIGESLLDYFSKKEIKNYLENAYSYKDNEFADIFVFPKTQNSSYGMLQISIKPKENKSIIYAIGGQISYQNNISKCYAQKDKMGLDIDKMISSSTEVKRVNNKKHNYDKTGKSFVSSIYYFLENGSIDIQCYDWSKKLEKRFEDKLMISFKSNEFKTFIVNEAY
ncbi:hypothetical protein N9T13_00425 [Candidatus Pelagibacter sp.]|nr:hypothetical protein [Candidatus Pelagibacter sp.]